MAIRISNITGTYSNAAYSYDGIGFNVNNFASAADSKLMHLKTDNVSRFIVYANGSVVVNGSLIIANSSISTGGSNTEVQFNDSGTSNGSATFTYNKSSNTMSVGNTSINSSAVLPGVVAMNYQTIANDYTIPTGYSAILAGPITITTGKTLAVANGARLVIL
jgi:hypothetical protein